MHRRDACATNGSPKPEYDKVARLDELASFEVQFAYDIDPMSDDLLAPKGLVNMPDTGEPGAGPPGCVVSAQARRMCHQ